MDNHNILLHICHIPPCKHFYFYNDTSVSDLNIVELPDLGEAAHVGLGVLVVPELDGLGPVVAPLHHGAGLQMVAPQLAYA